MRTRLGTAPARYPSSLRVRARTDPCDNVLIDRQCSRGVCTPRYVSTLRPGRMPRWPITRTAAPTYTCFARPRCPGRVRVVRTDRREFASNSLLMFTPVGSSDRRYFTIRQSLPRIARARFSRDFYVHVKRVVSHGTGVPYSAGALFEFFFYFFIFFHRSRHTAAHGCSNRIIRLFVHPAEQPILQVSLSAA